MALRRKYVIIAVYLTCDRREGVPVSILRAEAGELLMVFVMRVLAVCWMLDKLEARDAFLLGPVIQNKHP